VFTETRQHGIKCPDSANANGSFENRTGRFFRRPAALLLHEITAAMNTTSNQFFAFIVIYIHSL
jgi:hypothetical protein